MSRIHKLICGLMIVALPMAHQGLAVPAPGNGLPSQLQLVVEGLDNSERGLRDFYRSRDYAPLWLDDSPEARQRLRALTLAVDSAPTHGIPPSAVMRNRMLGITASDEDPLSTARADIEFSRIYLNYANIMHTGVLDPSEISEQIVIRKPRSLAERELLDGITEAGPVEYITGLAPGTPAYNALRDKLQTVSEHVAQGGWGPSVVSRYLVPGESGTEVIKLRNRLIRMGYINRTASPHYDLNLEQGVRKFQYDHGLVVSGTADTGTITAINVSAFERMQQVVSSLERLRWRQGPDAGRRIIVNIPEYLARVYNDGEVMFESNVVVGKTDNDLQTPEFSDIMEYVVINPNWNVPYSIVTEEILPELVVDGTEWDEIEFLDDNSIPIQRVEIDFTEFANGKGFPYSARQMPGPTNPLGNVKFIFPNRHNIYLHDSPMRELFDHQQRAYSHGCVRVQGAHDLARSLLENEGVDFDGLVAATSGTPDEVHVYLLEKIPVQITYQTVLHGKNGKIEFLNDIYGRDKLIYNKINNLGGTLLDSSG